MPPPQKFPLARTQLLAAQIYDEAHLSDATGLDHAPDLTDMALYVVGRDGEKFVTNSTIIAGILITVSFVPEEPGVCGGMSGGSYLYIIDVRIGEGYSFEAEVRNRGRSASQLGRCRDDTDPRIVVSGSGGGFDPADARTHPAGPGGGGRRHARWNHRRRVR